jgi:SAM-dependent methyltransferase
MTLYCKECGFGMIEQDVDSSVLQKYYSSDYSGKAKKRAEIKAIDNRTSYSHDIRSISQLALIRQYIDINSEAVIAEIGVGTGGILFTLKQNKFNGKYIAFEPQEQAHDWLRDLGGNIEKDVFTYNNASKYKNSVDLVIMSHSLEHFSPGDIESIMGAVEVMLKNGGVFFCEVPNADLSLYPNAGEMVVPHLSFFSIESLKEFISKTKMSLSFINACGDKQHDKNASEQIKELDEKGFFIFDLDPKNDILRNRKYHQYLEKSRKKQEKQQFFINIFLSIFGNKIYMLLINYIRKYRQEPVASLMADNHFCYEKSREFIRLIAIK